MFVSSSIVASRIYALFVVKSTRVPRLGAGGSSQSWQCQDSESFWCGNSSLIGREYIDWLKDEASTTTTTTAATETTTTTELKSCTEDNCPGQISRQFMNHSLITLCAKNTKPIANIWVRNQLRSPRWMEHSSDNCHFHWSSPCAVNWSRLHCLQDAGLSQEEADQEGLQPPLWRWVRKSSVHKFWLWLYGKLDTKKMIVSSQTRQYLCHSLCWVTASTSKGLDFQLI